MFKNIYILIKIFLKQNKIFCFTRRIWPTFILITYNNINTITHIAWSKNLKRINWISICSDVLGWSLSRQNSESVRLQSKPNCAHATVSRRDDWCTSLSLWDPLTPHFSLSVSSGEGTVVAAGRSLTVALLNLVPCRWQAPSRWRRVTFFPTGGHIVAACPHARGPGTSQQARVTSKPRKLTAAACRPRCPAPVCNQY